MSGLFCWPLWQPLCWLPTEVSGENGWASAATDKLSSLPGHDGGAHGTHVGRQADAFPPLLCPFSYLPDRGLTQAGISHPIDNEASVSCRPSHPLTGAHPSFRLFLVSPPVCLFFKSSRGVLLKEKSGSGLQTEIGGWSGLRAKGVARAVFV